MIANRRRFLLSAGAAGLAMTAGACASLPRIGGAGAPASAAAPTSDPAVVARQNALFERIFAEQVKESPEGATTLGLDKGENAAAKGRLDDRSQAGMTRTRRLVEGWNAELAAIDRSKLAGMDRVNHDTVLYQGRLIEEGLSKFAYGVRTFPAPYVLSQLTGAYQQVPDFLDSQHSIETAQDAEAYLSRLNFFAVALDQETDRAREDMNRGVVPPDFAVDKTIVQLRALRDAQAKDSVLVQSIARRTREKSIAGDWEARATRIYDGAITAALDRQLDLMQEMRRRAVHDAGVWRLPDGEAYYAWGARYSTTTNLTGEEIHQLGLQQVAEISNRLDGVLKGLGFTQGTVGQRIAAMGKDPRYLYPNTDAGKAQLLADLNEQMRVLATRLPELFGTLPKAPVEVKRVPTFIEAGAPGGYYQPPTLDGSRPGAYYINLRDTAEWPKWSLPTLTYHEASPGHHLQIALSLEAPGIPMLRRIVGFSAYSEGWALYAEQLADEIGMYENDPAGRVGYLQSLLFRSVRLVVDSGLHHKRWSREQAIRYMVDTLGDQESSVTTEVERYAVWPGQASSYKVGHTEWVRLREKARQALGSRFDLRAFHDAGLLAGGMPLAVLSDRIDDWIAERRG